VRPSLEDFLANDPTIREITAQFVRSLGERAGLFEAALADRDLPRLRSLAHSLKGEGGTFGLGSLSVAARRVEVALERGEPSALGESVNELALLCRKTAA
jgi:HPt (histidine-containing phosphotransfer) domain-containing protein